MKTKRTTVDFSEHELQIIKNENVLIHILHKNKSSIHKIVFINSMGVLSVTGDYGNWIFCREFHPSSDGYASGGYWDEKLEINSVQKSSDFDSQETEKEINWYVETYIDENTDQETIDWIDELRENIDDKYDYIQKAYREHPIDIDSEMIPFGEKRNVRLDIIYDAFDEICSRL